MIHRELPTQHNMRASFSLPNASVRNDLQSLGLAPCRGSLLFASP